MEPPPHHCVDGIDGAPLPRLCSHNKWGIRCQTSYDAPWCMVGILDFSPLSAWCPVGNYYSVSFLPSSFSLTALPHGMHAWGSVGKQKEYFLKITYLTPAFEVCTNVGQNGRLHIVTIAEGARLPQYITPWKDVPHTRNAPRTRFPTRRV